MAAVRRLPDAYHNVAGAFELLTLYRLFDGCQEIIRENVGDFQTMVTLKLSRDEAEALIDVALVQLKNMPGNTQQHEQALSAVLELMNACGMANQVIASTAAECGRADMGEG
jgi:hypothetical protein